MAPFYHQGLAAEKAKTYTITTQEALLTHASQEDNLLNPDAKLGPKNQKRMHHKQ